MKIMKALLLVTLTTFTYGLQANESNSVMSESLAHCYTLYSIKNTKVEVDLSAKEYKGLSREDRLNKLFAPNLATVFKRASEVMHNQSLLKDYSFEKQFQLNNSYMTGFVFGVGYAKGEFLERVAARLYQNKCAYREKGLALILVSEPVN